MTAAGFIGRATAASAELRPFAASADLARRHLSCAVIGPCEGVLIGRLYYRDDRLAGLRGRLAAADYEQCRENDAALVAALCAEGGPDALASLEGDFALAVYDRRERRLIALRDPLGAYPLFWTGTDGGVNVATSIRALIDDARPPDVDEEFVADYLAFPTDAVAELPTERTVYRGISRLRPGWILTSRLSSGVVERRPAWDWTSRIASVRVSTAADAAALVRDRLDAAVAARMSRRLRTACHLSGGTDSTAVALLAAERAPSADRGVVGLTLVWAGDAGLARESGDAAAAAAGCARLEQLRIPADDFLEFDSHERIPLLDEPAPTIVDLRPSEALAEAARTAGADTILNGNGGDHLFQHAAPVLVAGLLRAGRVPRALTLARAHAAARTGSTWEIVREALRVLAPAQCRAGLRPWLRGGRTTFATMTPLQVPPWFRSPFARTTALLSRTMRYRAPRFDGHPFGVPDVETVAGDWHHWHVAVPRGLVESRPFFDTRLVAAALAIPPHLHEAPRPMKPVLAAALEGVVPASILQRPTKASFNNTLGGFGRHQAWLDDLIRRAPLDDGMVDREVLAACVQDVTLGIFRDAPSVGRLRMTLTFLIWLSQRERWMAQPLPPAIVSSV